MSVCSETQSPPGTGYLIPPDDAWWACTTGVTPCVPTQVLINTQGFCVLVQLVPKIAYYPEKEILHRLEPLWRAKREVFTAVLMSSLPGLGLAGDIGTKTSALVFQD